MLRKFGSSLLGTAFQKLFESPRTTTKKIKTLKHSTPIINSASTIATIHSCSPLKNKIKFYNKVKGTSHYKGRFSKGDQQTAAWLAERRVAGLIPGWTKTRERKVLPL